QNVSTNANQSAGADVRQLRTRAGTEVVYLDQTNPGAAILAANNRRVGGGARRQRDHNGGLFVIGWSKRSLFDRRLLRLARLVVDLPIVIRSEKMIRRVAQLEDGIGQKRWNTAGPAHRPN